MSTCWRHGINLTVVIGDHGLPILACPTCEHMASEWRKLQDTWASEGSPWDHHEGRRKPRETE